MTASVETMVRKNDHWTSKEAAFSISENTLNDLEDIILFALTHKPMADHELVEHLTGYTKVTPQRIRTVRKYLTVFGLVELSELEPRLTPSGHNALVYQGVRS
jgi:hypothetical protein